MDGFTVYLIAKLTTIVAVFTAFTMIGFLSVAILLISYAIWEGERNERSKEGDFQRVEYAEKMKAKLISWSKIFGVFSTVLLFCAVLIPDTKQAAAIYVVPKITQNEKIEGISEKGLELLEEKLEVELEDMKKNNDQNDK